MGEHSSRISGEVWEEGGICSLDRSTDLSPQRRFFFYRYFDCLSSKQPGCFCDKTLMQSCPGFIGITLQDCQTFSVPRGNRSIDISSNSPHSPPLLIFSRNSSTVMTAKPALLWLHLHIKIIVNMLLSDPKYETYFYSGRKCSNCLVLL